MTIDSIAVPLFSNYSETSKLVYMTMETTMKTTSMKTMTMKTTKTTTLKTRKT